MEQGRQGAARTVEPALGWQAGGVGVARAVNAKAAIAAIVAKERLEKRRPPGPAHDGGGGAGELFGDRPVGIVAQPGIAEKPPCQRDRRRLRQRGQKGRQRAVARVDIDVFVDVEDQHPIGGLAQRVLARQLQRRPLRPLRMRPVIADMGQPAHRLHPVQHRVGAIGAVVRQHEGVGEPHRPVVGEPVDEKGAFVLDRQHGKEARISVRHRPHAPR